MSHFRKKVEIVVRLPKEFKIESLDVTSIPLDENSMVTIREGHRNIGEMKLKHARQKYG